MGDRPAWRVHAGAGLMSAGVFACASGSPPLAEVIASNERVKREAAASHPAAMAGREGDAENTRGALAQARQQLSTTEARLERADRLLSTEKQARAEAEKKARQALDTLAVSGAFAVKDEPRGTVITVPSGVLFASREAGFLAGAQAKLESVAETLNHEDGHSIVIEGHADAQGSDAATLELSRRRAETVKEFLTARNVSADRVSARGVGAARPVADNSTAEGRATNRKVEIVIQPIESR
jgi:outer membrane protein OmpA-like peptidoglycan-associated protein